MAAVPCGYQLTRARGRTGKLSGALLWRLTTSRKEIQEKWRCVDCSLMRKRNRWCGYIKHKKEFDNEKNIGTLVWRDKDGGYRHELTECPVSVLSRSDYYVNAATQWLLVESPPDGWRDMPLSTWQRIRACYVELKWYSNNAGMEGK